MYRRFHFLGFVLGCAVVCPAGSGQTGRVYHQVPMTVGRQAGTGSTAGNGPDAAVSPQNTTEPPAKGDGAPASAPETVLAEATADSGLQLAIQNALEKEPSLAGTSVRTTVSENGIELTGSVATSRAKLNAGRLALSYAGNKRLLNRITVTGRTVSAPVPAAHSPENGANPSPANHSQPSEGVNQLANPGPTQGARPPLP